MLLLLSCTQSKVEKQLMDIETYIMDRPDSALAVLESMDRSLLVTEEDKAHHALLHAMALDKNFIDVADDSLARIAVDYYCSNGPQEYAARSLYYLGLAYFYQKDYNEAIVEFTKAEEKAKGVDDTYLGFIKAAKARTYNKTFNSVEALKCLREAYEIDKKSGNEYYIQTSKLDLSNALYNAGCVEESLKLLSELLDDSAIDETVRLYAKVAYAFINAAELDANFPEVVEIFEDVTENSSEIYLSLRDYWAWAYSLYKVGRKDEAQNLIEQLALDKSGTSSYWQYKIAKSDGNLLSALDHLEDYIEYNNVEVSDALKQELAVSQRDYYESQSELSKAKAENSELMMSIVLMASIFGFVLVILGILWYVKKQRRIKEQYILCISEIRHQLDEAKKDDYPALKKKYLSIYKSRFVTIGELCEQYVHSQGLVNAEKSVYKKVVSLVDDFTNDYSNREKFESMLDEDLDNIMSNLREEMPSLKDKDYMIFGFLVIGFDVTTISNLMNITANTVYIRKSRIKNQILTQNPSHRDQFIDAMG